MIEEVKSAILSTDSFEELIETAHNLASGGVCRITGLAGSMRALVAGALSEQVPRQQLFLVSDSQEAQQLVDDLSLVTSPDRIRRFSAQTAAPVTGDATVANVEDVETLRALLDGTAGIVVTDVAAVATRIPNPASLQHRVIFLETGNDHNFTALHQHLAEFGFERVQFVESVGEYSIRGGILDIFPFVGENPLRIEFFGDTIESIREFDPVSQRSIKELSRASIVPDLLSSQEQTAQTSTLLDFLRSDALVLLDEPDILRRSLEERPHAAGIEWSAVSELLSLFGQIHLTALVSASGNALHFGALPHPPINGSIKVLRGQLAGLQARGVYIYISSDTEAERERLKDLLSDLQPVTGDEENTGHDTEPQPDVAQISFTLEALHAGFLLPDARLALFTEHQIFNRLKRRGKPRRAKFKGITQRELHQLRKGDYVVHADFGIGRFDGLKKITVREVEQEVVKMLYEEKDTLYVNLNYINKIQKYASKEGHIPKLTRLGSGEWDRLRARAKKRVKDIARDLIRLYAERKHAHGFAFYKDTLWQRELEASFMYEDTPDQEKATRDFKQDMEASFPMDRLICGDVGFGKTEVAVRAAFKSVMSGKQVALLVPTTILAQQHYHTFLDRLSKYSTHIEVISRFKTRKEQAEIIERLKSGSTDIVIGTHRLLSKDVRFKDLGLLIIDEEHRFGVSAKEKLRQLKTSVDTLTLTATPIPRTLHFSLMGARDLSIIATPPPNRLPVITEIAQYDEEHVREAILREIHRGGQVFFVHDRVQNMSEVIGRLQSVLPQVKFRQAHGQMHAHELEDVMLAFLEKQFDVLVATKIIESGIDIPSVNTIIINRADRFGMAELYQLRGRVGRSNVQAYAYLLTPPLASLPRETVRRLQAVEEFTELGSGFNLAMRDLEIRGAGNLLGGEQSGFIESMGFEMYTKILEEAVGELKEAEFRDLFAQQAQPSGNGQAVVEADFDVRIPESFIENDNERLLIYRRLYGVTAEAPLTEIGDELTDRFGRFPPEVNNLFNLVRVRMKASELGFRKVNISPGSVTMEFPPESDTTFYEGGSFQLLMTHISGKKDRRTVLRQNGGILVLSRAFGKAAGNPFSETLNFLDELHAAVHSEDVPEQVNTTDV